MNLINDSERAIYESALNDMHETFSRDITVVYSTKTPKTPLEDASDDYDHINNSNQGTEEFEYSYIESTVKARIKYVDKQDKEFSLITTLGGEQLNLTQEFGLLRIKVLAADCQAINDSTHLIIDSNHCKVMFRDKPHGLFDGSYCTFYAQRIP